MERLTAFLAELYNTHDMTENEVANLNTEVRLRRKSGRGHKYNTSIADQVAEKCLKESK